MALALGTGFGYWVWVTWMVGETVAVLELPSGRTTPLMGLNISLVDSGLSARIGSLRLTPQRSPYRVDLAQLQPRLRERMRYRLRILDTAGAIVREQSGWARPWVRAFPGAPPVRLPAFEIHQPGRYYLDVLFETSSSDRPPGGRLRLLGRVVVLEPRVFVGLGLVLAVGLALTRMPSRGRANRPIPLES